MEDEDCLKVDLAGLKGFFGLVNANHLNQKIYPNLGSDKFLMNKKVRIFMSWAVIPKRLYISVRGLVGHSTSKLKLY